MADLAALTDEQLRRMLNASVLMTLVLSFALASGLVLLWGWQTGLLLLVGGLVSASGIWEWKRLIAVLNAHLDASAESKATGRVVLLFLLRLGLALAVLYGSLKFLDGSFLALVGGLGLAVISLTFYAIRLIFRPA